MFLGDFIFEQNAPRHKDYFFTWPKYFFILLSTTILHIFNEFLKLYIYWSDSTCSEYHLRLDIMKMHIEFRSLGYKKIGLLTKRGVHSFHFDKNINTNQLFFPSNFIENCKRENPES